MHLHLWILIIGVPFVLINEAAKAPGRAAGKQRRITQAPVTKPPVNKSRIHKSVKRNGSKKWPNRTQPPFRLYQKSGKTAFTLKPWHEAEHGNLENGTLTFYNRMGFGITVYEFKHYIHKNNQSIYSEKFKNIVIQKARLTGDIPFRYHGSDPEYSDYWSILYIFEGKNRTTTREKFLYNIGPGPGAILFVSFQRHNCTGLAFRRVGFNEATFAIHPV